MLHLEWPNGASRLMLWALKGNSAMSKSGQHVVPNAGGWSVKRAGATRATSTHATQAEAVKAATQIARNQGTELYVHGKDGRIRERNSYGKDPHPPKG